MTVTTTERDGVPTDDQFDDPDDAAERAAELGLGGVHWHPDGDDGRVWMPGGSHAEYEDAVGQEAGLREDWEDRLVQQDDPCWDGYTMVGLQDDGTPRCVPDDDVEDYDESEAATEQEKWAEETGPQGGDRWRNTETDEVVYDEPAGFDGSEGDEPTDSPDEIPADVQVKDEETVEEINDSLDADLSLAEHARETQAVEEEFAGLIAPDTAALIAADNLLNGTVLPVDDGGDGDGNGDVAPPTGDDAYEPTGDAGPAELDTLSDGDEITVDTDRAGELQGTVEETEFLEFGELLITDETGSEHVIPVEDINDVQTAAVGQAGTINQQATFGEGEAVRWSWQGEPVHGRVAEVREEAATPEGSDQQITGDDGEPVYLIDEWDDRVEAFRRETVAKPESALSPSRKDLPVRRDDTYVDSEAWESLRMPVRESAFSTAELDHVAAAHPDILQQLDATTWALADGTAVYTADVPARYDDIDLTPTEGMQTAAQRVLDVSEETDNPNDCLAPAGWARARDIAGGRRLRPDTWREMDAFFARKGAQGSDDADGRVDRTDCQWMEWQAWGGDAGASRAATVTDQLDRADADAEMELQGAVAAQRSVESITEADSNRVDLDSLTDEERAAVEAEDFHLYGKASIEQWNRDESVYIQMDALETALERFFDSETAPGIISRHHQDIPVGVPVREFEFAEDTTLQIGDETYDFAAGDVARSHVEDADGDGRPELWLAANISNDNEMAKKTRVLALRDDLDGFSVTIHRNEDRITDDGGTIVTAADLHAVTIGTAEQIRNEGSEFDVASYSAAAIRRVRDRVASIV